MRDECAAVEHSVSYTRRLAQGRFEILSAEQQRREDGGSVRDLVADLPRILGDERGRPSAPNSRLTKADEPLVEIDWGPHAHLIADNYLINLTTLSGEDLVAMLGALSDFERE